MSRYAENTTVPVDRSKAEIERILARYGATGFGYVVVPNQAVVAFHAHGRDVRFVLSMPDPNSPEFRTTPAGRRRQGDQVNAAYEQEVRRRWRALALCIKGKLEAVNSEIVTFDEEFMAHIVLPDKTTVAEFMTPQIEEAYKTGKMPALLPMLE